VLSVCAAARGAKQSGRVLGGLTATKAESSVQAEHRLNLARQIGKMATRIDRRFLSRSDPLLIPHALCAQFPSSDPL